MIWWLEFRRVLFRSGVGRRSAHFGIQLVVIGDVVAVRTAGLGGKVRRGVDRADPETLEVRNDIAGRGQRKTAVHLQPVRADRHEMRPIHYLTLPSAAATGSRFIQATPTARGAGCVPNPAGS